MGEDCSVNGGRPKGHTGLLVLPIRAGTGWMRLPAPGNGEG